jgi:hypothetical protein
MDDSSNTVILQALVKEDLAVLIQFVSRVSSLHVLHPSLSVHASFRHAQHVQPSAGSYSPSKKVTDHMRDCHSATLDPEQENNQGILDKSRVPPADPPVTGLHNTN